MREAFYLLALALAGAAVAPYSQASTRLGESCGHSEPGKVCLALKYVTYKDLRGIPTLSEDAALANLNTVNRIYAPCHVGFEVEDFEQVIPSEKGLSYSPTDMMDMERIRRAYSSDSMLVVVTTGAWQGTLRNGSANAWTEMPGEGPYGAIMEYRVADYGPLVAHEIGHYLNLDHLRDQADLMNPIVYRHSIALGESQCAAVRTAANSYWSKMVR